MGDTGDGGSGDIVWGTQGMGEVVILYGGHRGWGKVVILYGGHRGWGRW